MLNKKAWNLHSLLLPVHFNESRVVGLVVRYLAAFSGTDSSTEFRLALSSHKPEDEVELKLIKLFHDVREFRVADVERIESKRYY